ncbi:hypothetical protein FQA39_LY05375 [Lamprigera yunnana]|nr:hypothetical protein FQA39_LY05375 [Lamprigera yunnana]
MDLTELKCEKLKNLLKGRGLTCSDDADINKEILTKHSKQKCMSNKRKLKVLNTINYLKSKIEILNLQLAKLYKQVKKINYKLVKSVNYRNFTPADKNFKHSNSIENNIIDFNNRIQHKQKFETSNDCDKNVIGNNSFSPSPGIKNSKKILILADSNGKNMSATLSGVLSHNYKNYQIQSMIKSNVCLEGVVQDIENLTRKFTRSDYVIILGGSSDFLDKNKISINDNILKLICKAVFNTNLLYCSIPYTNTNKISTINDNIFKTNCNIWEKICNYQKTCDNIVQVDINSVLKYNCYTRNG